MIEEILENLERSERNYWIREMKDFFAKSMDAFMNYFSRKGYDGKITVRTPLPKLMYIEKNIIKKFPVNKITKNLIEEVYIKRYENADKAIKIWKKNVVKEMVLDAKFYQNNKRFDGKKVFYKILADFIEKTPFYSDKYNKFYLAEQRLLSD